ncbi:MAG TPA: flagellar export protein FliJ [Acidimicrobiia bacterium]|nr:flagellar export protein FliJ [Acidimicrobiia bacterium]
MKRYRFRLETVLRVRRVEEERQLAALASARQAATAAERAAVDCLTHYRSLADVGGRASTYDFVAARGRLGLAAGSVRDAQATHARAVEAAETQRERWTEAARRVSSLERLDERGRAEHAVEARRDEDRTVDDLVTGRFGRKP